MTWAVWISSTTRVNELLRLGVPGDEFWEAGRLHVLSSAPRTWVGRARLKVAPKVDQEQGEDCIMLVLRFVGAERWAYNTLRYVSQSPCMRGPLRLLLAQAEVEADDVGGTNPDAASSSDPTANRSAGQPTLFNCCCPNRVLQSCWLCCHRTSPTTWMLSSSLPLWASAPARRACTLSVPTPELARHR